MAETKKKKEEKKKPQKPREYNPRWKGYCLIMLFSLINLSAVSNTYEESGEYEYDGKWGLCLSFGSFTFAVSFLILMFDRLQLGVDFFNYTKAFNGRFEGYVLLFITLWWVVGVAYITQVGGMAYFAMNIYLSSWMALASCIYTLNKWSSAKDILSIQELTGISATLKSWYILLVASLVVMASSSALFRVLRSGDRRDAGIGIGFGLASSLLSFGWILVHYNFIEFCNEGGWLELLTSFVLIVLWIVACAILTKDGGIASTIDGTKCGEQTVGFDFQSGNCTIIFQDLEGVVSTFNCSETVNREIPGSNLYLATWTCLAASLNITLRWKAQQALQFAQAQNRKAMTEANMQGDDDEEDLEDFEDAEM